MNDDARLHNQKLALQDPNSSGSILLLIVSSKLHKSDKNEPLAFLSWDPEALKLEIKDAFNVVMSDSSFNRLMAAREIYTSDRFWVKLPDFIDICNALASGSFDPRVFDLADMEEIAWAVLESALLWPYDNDTEHKFSEDILAYIREVAKSEGLTDIPDILKFAIPKDDDVWNRIQAQFSDDPHLFTSIYQLSKDKSNSINQSLLERLTYMLKQAQVVGLPETTIKFVSQVRQLLANSVKPSE